MEVKEEKRHYPRMVVNNHYVLTILSTLVGGMIQKVYFKTKKEAEEAISWISKEFGRTPDHTIEEF